MGAGLCPSPHQADQSLVAPVCAVCPGLAGGSEFGGQTAAAGWAGGRGAAAPRGLAPAGALGVECGQCDGWLAP